jgi:hypothetical protein
VVVAVNWSKLPAAVGIPDWNGRIVIDANTPIGLFQADRSARPRIDRSLRRPRTWCSRREGFNHLRAEVLAGDPRADPDRGLNGRRLAPQCLRLSNVNSVQAGSSPSSQPRICGSCKKSSVTMVQPDPAVESARV